VFGPFQGSHSQWYALSLLYSRWLFTTSPTHSVTASPYGNTQQIECMQNLLSVNVRGWIAAPGLHRPGTVSRLRWRSGLVIPVTLIACGLVLLIFLLAYFRHALWIHLVDLSPLF